MTLRLDGFTVEELRRIMLDIRRVEAHDPAKHVFLFLDCPDLNVEDTKDLIRTIWPQ